MVFAVIGCNADIANVELTGITVTPPAKITYEVGESLNTEGMTVTAVYSDESSKDVTAEAGVGEFDNETAGTKTVTVSYTEDEITVSSSFEVTVNEKPVEEPPAENPPAEEPPAENPPATSVSLVGIEITTNPSKMSYFVNETFDNTDMVVTATYSDNSKKEVTGWETSELDSSSTGSKKITVSYTEGEITKTTELEVEVTDLVLERIEIESKPSKTEYYVDDNFDDTGMKVKAFYTNGTSEYVTNYTTNFDEVKTKTGNNKEVTVTYIVGSNEKTATFNVTIKKKLQSIKITKQPLNLYYSVGDKLDTTGMVVTATYLDGTPNGTNEDLPLEWLTITGFNSEKEGTNIITVSYYEKTAEFSVTIKKFNIVKVTFYPNGGTGNAITQDLKGGIEQILAANTFIAPSGKAFLGWATSQNAKEPEYGDGARITIDKDTSLYAFWFNINGGLLGTASGNQKQGAFIDGSNLSQSAKNLKINGNTIEKTSEVIIVPKGQTALITMPDDSSWDSYFGGGGYYDYYKGIFLKNRRIKLNPFVMSQYEVTQKLYNAVMKTNPSNFKSASGNEKADNLPVENVTWYQACAFCNELTKLLFGQNECVYYSNETLTTVYTSTNAANSDTVYIAYNKDTHKFTKTGYRLPTEAEWEYAARGGDPNSEEWKYSYAGSQTEKSQSNFIGSPYEDNKLDDYGWHKYNSNNKTHEVGIKTKNKLNLYDMSGNVIEWCWDVYDANVTKNDDNYKNVKLNFIENPLGALPSGTLKYGCRGGGWDWAPGACAVSSRLKSDPTLQDNKHGFRLVRSIQ